MIQYTILFSFLMLVAFGAMQCTGPSNDLVIEGVLSNLPQGANAKIYLDKVTPNENILLQNMDLSADGKFAFNIPAESTDKDIFRLRVNNKTLFVSNEDDAKSIVINADMNTTRQVNYTVEGSPASTMMADLYGKISGLSVNANDFKQAVESAYPYSAA